MTIKPVHSPQTTFKYKGSSMFILAYLHIHNGTSHIPLSHYLSLLHYLHYFFIRLP